MKSSLRRACLFLRCLGVGLVAVGKSGITAFAAVATIQAFAVRRLGLPAARSDEMQVALESTDYSVASGQQFLY